MVSIWLIAVFTIDCLHPLSCSSILVMVMWWHGWLGSLHSACPGWMQNEQGTLRGSWFFNLMFRAVGPRRVFEAWVLQGHPCFCIVTLDPIVWFTPDVCWGYKSLLLTAWLWLHNAWCHSGLDLSSVELSRTRAGTCFFKVDNTSYFPDDAAHIKRDFSYGNTNVIGSPD